MILLPIDAHIIIIAKTFPLTGIARCLSHCIIASPKIGIEVSHLCILGEHLAKQKEATMTKGVVGIIGKKAPIIPKIRQSQPKL